jgi:hypothetical protein
LIEAKAVDQNVLCAVASAHTKFMHKKIKNGQRTKPFSSDIKAASAMCV